MWILGVDAKFNNDAYAAAGANIVSPDKAFHSDIILKVTSKCSTNAVDDYMTPGWSDYIIVFLS